MWADNPNVEDIETEKYFINFNSLILYQKRVVVIRTKPKLVFEQQDKIASGLNNVRSMEQKSDDKDVFRPANLRGHLISTLSMWGLWSILQIDDKKE